MNPIHNCMHDASSGMNSTLRSCASRIQVQDFGDSGWIFFLSTEKIHAGANIAQDVLPHRVETALVLSLHVCPMEPNWLTWEPVVSTILCIGADFHQKQSVVEILFVSDHQAKQQKPVGNEDFRFPKKLLLKQQLQNLKRHQINDWQVPFQAGAKYRADSSNKQPRGKLKFKKCRRRWRVEESVLVGAEGFFKTRYRNLKENNHSWDWGVIVV